MLARYHEIAGCSHGKLAVYGSSPSQVIVFFLLCKFAPGVAREAECKVDFQLNPS